MCSKLPLFFEPSESQNDQNTFSNKDLQDLIVKNVKQTLADVDAEEFILFIRLLASLPSMTSLQGRQDLVNIIIAQSELDKPFNVKNLNSKYYLEPNQRFLIKKKYLLNYLIIF